MHATQFVTGACCQCIDKLLRSNASLVGFANDLDGMRASGAERSITGAALTTVSALIGMGLSLFGLAISCSRRNCFHSNIAFTGHQSTARNFRYWGQSGHRGILAFRTTIRLCFPNAEHSGN